MTHAFSTPHGALRHFAAALICCLLPALAGAQTQVRVTADHVVIWKPGFAVVASVVNTGDVLQVVGRLDTWYKVVVPGPPGQPETGFIAVTRVEAIGGAPPRSRTSPRPRTARSQTASRATAASNRSSLRLLGQVGYGWFAADQSFEAVTDSSGGLWFGGGVRYDSTRHYFIEGTVERYQATGERVFVLDDEVFKLGIENTVSITPLMVSGGYSVRTGGMTTYVGGGIGAYLLRETSDITDDAEDVEETSAAYRAVAGVLWSLGRYAAAGVELQYTTVPDALEGGVAARFEESNLGGLQVNVKVLFGR